MAATPSVFPVPVAPARKKSSKSKSEDPEAAAEARIEEYRAQFAHPYLAAARGYVDDVIDPRTTRPRLINALEMLRNKRDENPRKKHGNVPL